MTPWEVVELLACEDQEHILASLGADHPFWIGASYAIDPFVGIICRLPLRNPRQYGNGIQPAIFDKVVRYILDGSLTGDSLVMAIEQLSMHSQEAEWTRWYKPILKGELNLRLPLDLFNRYVPDEFRIPPPAINQPKPVTSENLPKRFVITPDYGERTFWLINSKIEPIEISAYDAQVKRYENLRAVANMVDFARRHEVDIVLIGFMQGDDFLAEDVLTRDQFTQESGAQPLHHRLTGLVKLGLPLVQMTDVLTPEQPESFYHELNLIFEQRYPGAIVRDLDAHYPFRIQSDLLIRPTVKSTLVAHEFLNGEIKAEYVTAKKQITTTVRLGLNEVISKDICDSQDRRFDVVSCGVKDGRVLYPVFKNWRNK